MKTYAPSSTNPLAVANPTPVEPPVINAVFPFRSAMIMPFASSGLPGQELPFPGSVFTVDEDGDAWTFLGGPSVEHLAILAPPTHRLGHRCGSRRPPRPRRPGQ